MNLDIIKQMIFESIAINELSISDNYTVYDYDLVKSEKHGDDLYNIYEFQHKDLKYIVSLNTLVDVFDEENFVEVSFTVKDFKGSYDVTPVTNKGYVNVIHTVLNIVKDFVEDNKEEYNIEKVKFSAVPTKEEYMKGVIKTKREKLYMFYIKHYFPNNKIETIGGVTNIYL